MKCSFCNKKTIILIKCKCKNNFCITHLPYDIHNCNHIEPLFTIEKIVKDKLVKI